MDPGTAMIKSSSVKSNFLFWWVTLVNTFISIDAIKIFFDQCISIGNTKTKKEIAHLHNNEDICPSRGINLLLVSTVVGN